MLACLSALCFKEMELRKKLKKGYIQIKAQKRENGRKK